MKEFISEWLDLNDKEKEIINDFVKKVQEILTGNLDEYSVPTMTSEDCKVLYTFLYKISIKKENPSATIVPLMSALAESLHQCICYIEKQTDENRKIINRFLGACYMHGF